MLHIFRESWGWVDEYEMGNHNPFDLTIPLTTNIFIGFDLFKIYKNEFLMALTTGLCSSQRE